MESEQQKHKKIKKYSTEIDEKIVELGNAGKTVKEIKDFFNGHPASPKIKRVLKVNNIELK